MKTSFTPALLLVAAAVVNAQPGPDWLIHDRNRPLPPVVDPGTASTPEKPGRPPSDAIVLFDGADLRHWVSMDGTPARWVVRDGFMERAPGAGDIRTERNFGDSQLRVEWAAPTPVSGAGQGRGNSGVFFGLNRYEVQVLDSHQNTTYADGSAGAIYGQRPPLVNASRSPGQWQTYDIIYTAPRFDADGNLLSPARITAFHNGVLIQNNVELTGPTPWLVRPPYSAHPEKLPIALQDHGNPVRFRSIWVRELGPPGRAEFTLPHALLERYAGRFERATFTREGHQLAVTFAGSRFPLFAESNTRFFSKQTDLEFEFRPGATREADEVLYTIGGEGGGVMRRAR